MIDSVDKAMNIINQLKELGLKIAIDDFGTGYSSLSYLNTFPADILKVDRSFIEKMDSGSSHKKYVAAIISIVHIMNFNVVERALKQLNSLKSFEVLAVTTYRDFIGADLCRRRRPKSLFMSSV